jgi:hypothetical protein
LLGENCANEANPLAPSHNERGNGWTPKGTDWRRGSVVNYSPKSALSCWIVTQPLNELRHYRGRRCMNIALPILHGNLVHAYMVSQLPLKETEV